MTELSRIADQPLYAHIVTDLARMEQMAHWRTRQTLEQMDREMVLWRRGVILLAGFLIGAGLALYLWAATGA